jgi:uncharacterized protein involved in outer membrane biogenesis
VRDFLTGFAIILIVVLTAALAAPYFIDWNGQRGFLEARLSHALGQKVTIGGAIDLKLLPTPYLVLSQTVIGDDDGPITMGIHHLDLELSVTPLLHGEFDIVEARLEEPTIRVTLQRDRTLPALPAAPAFNADLRFDQIDVIDGTLAIADPQSGRTIAFEHLDLHAEAPSLAGPFKGAGTAGDARTKFRFGTTASQNGKARAHLVVEETTTRPGLDVEGGITLADAPHETLRQSFDGTVTLNGHLAPGMDKSVAWTLSGPLVAGPQSARVAGGQLRIGGDDGSLALQANLDGDFGATPSLHVDLAAKQLDIDRLAGVPSDGTKPPVPALPDPPTLRRMIAAIVPPLPTTVDLTVDSATWGGDTLEGVAAHWGIGGTTPQTVKLAGDGPGGLHLAIDGTLNPTATRGFDGTADLAIDNVPRAMGWLAAVAPASGFKAQDIPFRSIGLAGHVVSESGALDGTGLTLELGRSSLTGHLHLSPSTGTTNAKLTADLKARALDLDTLPDIEAMRTSTSPFDLDLHLDADALKVSRVGDGAFATGHIAVALTASAGTVALTRFKADDLGGATIDASGHLDPKGATLALSLDAKRLVDAAALVRRLAPGDAADALVARAPSLAPARLAIDLALLPTSGDALHPSRLTVDGRLGATTVKATLAPAADESIALDATLDAPEGSALIRQLGLPALPLDTIGRSRIVLAAHGQADQPLETTLTSNLGQTRFDVAGRFDLLAAGRSTKKTRSGAGSGHLTSPDLGPLIQSLGLAFPDMTGRIPADLRGGIAFGHAGLAFSDLAGQIGGTKASGTLQWTSAAGGAPGLTGSLDLDRLAVSTLLGLALGPPHTDAPAGGLSNTPFAAGLIDPPRTAIALKAKVLDLDEGLTATDAKADLGIAPNQVTIKHVAAGLAGGRLTADIALRRDGRTATAEGKIALDGVHVVLPGIDARATANLDLAGSGQSALGLVSSLAGSGTATLAGLRIPDADPQALPKVFADVEADALAVDEDSIVRALEEAGTAPLNASDRSFGLSLATGVLHLQPTDEPPPAPVRSSIEAALDLRTSTLEEHVQETLSALPKDWKGPLPSIVITLAGPIKAPHRTTDVSSLINAVATRALARESARIEAYEFDIRERALFNQRLQSEDRREQERLKADDDARRAEAERRARAEAARVEKQRLDEAAKRAKAEQDIRDAADARARAAAPRSQAPDPREGAAASDPGRSAPNQPSDPSALGRY